jgi:hypothetical protein
MAGVMVKSLQSYHDYPLPEPVPFGTNATNRFQQVYDFNCAITEDSFSRASRLSSSVIRSRSIRTESPS